MAWVSVPELEVTRSVQRYEPLMAWRCGLDGSSRLGLDEHGFVEALSGPG